MKNLLLFFLLALAIVPSFFAQRPAGGTGTAPNVYMLGNAAVRVPPPAGFVEISKTFEKVGARMRASEGQGNELLGVFVPTTLVPRLKQTQEIDLEFDSKLSVSKSGMNVDSTKQDYQAFVTEFEKNFDSYFDPKGETMQRTQKNADKGLTELRGEATNLNFTGTKNLGFIEKSDQVFSGMILFNFEIYNRKITMLCATSVVYVNRRILYLNSYKMSPTEPDYTMLRDFQKKWTTAIVAANR